MFVAAGRFRRPIGHRASAAAVRWRRLRHSAGCRSAFFAFAGYARIATLGEGRSSTLRIRYRARFRWPSRSPWSSMRRWRSVRCLRSAPPRWRKRRRRWSPRSNRVAGPRCRRSSGVGAAVASLGVLLSLLAGVSRTAFAMASNRDLPAFLDAVHPRYRVPARAEVVAGVIVAAIAALARTYATRSVSARSRC